MSGITVSATYPVSRRAVWRELSNLADHVTWMADADRITFHGDQRSGVGTAFTCRTKIGPFVTNDVLTITEWVDEERMGVVHTGIVTGTGYFALHGDSPTTLVWSESLRFPWWAGGALGAVLARPILRLVWRGNLRRFGRRCS